MGRFGIFVHILNWTACLTPAPSSRSAGVFIFKTAAIFLLVFQQCLQLDWAACLLFAKRSRKCPSWSVFPLLAYMIKLFVHTLPYFVSNAYIITLFAYPSVSRGMITVDYFNDKCIFHTEHIEDSIFKMLLLLPFLQLLFLSCVQACGSW